jgi:fatty-acyl-CoA synthase
VPIDATPAATLTDLLTRVAARHPDEPALIERDGDAFGTLTFAQLDLAAAALAGQLRARGVQRGDVVGVWLPNWSETIVWEFALAALGAAALGINTRYGVDELTHLLQRGRPVGLVVPARFLELDFRGRLRSAIDEARDQQTPWVAVVRGGDAGFDVGQGAWSPPSPREADPVPSRGAAVGEPGDPADYLAAGAPGDPANYFTTSGSTGMPKLAGHDQAGIARHCHHVAVAMDMRPGDRFLGVLPLSGVFGFNPAMAMLSAGGACLLEPVFDAPVVLADMETHGVTHVVGGDDMLGRLMDAWDSADHDQRPALKRLRRGGIADFAGRAAAVAAWAQRELGAAVSGVYGSSELFSLTSIWAAELELDERSRPGGTVVSDQIAVRAVDPESGRECSPQDAGELQFKGYNVVCGYLGDEAAARDGFTAEGWFRSGDLGFVVEPEGSFVYICRAGDALRLRGFLVEPAEIERFLSSHPAVQAAKVVGVSSASGGDLAVAYVQLVDGRRATGDELLGFCRERLAPFKVPSHLNLIDEFPVTTGTNGTKIRTAELRRRAQEQVAGESGDR